MIRTYDIYKLELFEYTCGSMCGNNVDVIRVPGGWLTKEYTEKSYVFVPYNEEFKKETK